MKKFIYSIFFTCISLSVNAIKCPNEITNLTLHRNGHIYFNTNNNCSASWCRIDWEDQKQVTRTYALLISAMLERHTVNIVFRDEDLATCSDVVTEHTTPNYIIFP